MSKLKIPLLHGTKRPGNESSKVARYIFEVLKGFDEVETVYVDPKDLNLPDDGDKIKDSQFSKITLEADAFFIVTPEYNHAIPSTLKRMIDSEYENFARKPVSIAGVSNGPWGGVRAIENSLASLKAVGLIVTHHDIQFPKVLELFDENNQIKDPNYKGKVEKQIKELLWYTKTLKWGRENVTY